MSAEQEEIEAIARLARSNDGPVIRRYLRRILEYVHPPGLTDGHLHELNGRRNVARDFMTHMDKGLEIPNAGSGSTDDAILRASGRPNVESAPRGIKRRVYADPSVATYLHDTDRYGDPPDAA